MFADGWGIDGRVVLFLHAVRSKLEYIKSADPERKCSMSRHRDKQSSRNVPYFHILFGGPVSDEPGSASSEATGKCHHR